MKVNILLGIAGFVGGFAAGYVTKHFLDKKTMKEMQDNLDYALNNMKENEKDDNDIRNKVDDQVDQYIKDMVDYYVQDYINGTEEFDDDEGYYQSDDPDDFVPEGFYNEQGPEEIDDDSDPLDQGPEEDGEEPYIINADLYSEHQEYTKCICEYYVSGGILCDGENGAIYEDLSPIGGLSMIAAMEEGKEDVIYIRNEPEMADFEITILRKSRYETKWG